MKSFQPGSFFYLCKEETNTLLMEIINDVSQLESFLVKGLGKKEVEQVAQSCVTNEELFVELLRFVIKGSKTQSMKASWIMANACIIHPEFATKHASEILELLQSGVNGGVQRELLKCIGLANLSDEQEGLLIDLSFEFLRSMKSDVGTKYYCIAYLRKVVTNYPELKNELILMLDAQKDYYTDAWKRYIRKQLIQLEKQKTRKV